MPFVGSGLTVGAGAPPVWRLAEEMVRRGNLAGITDPYDLVAVSAAAELQLELPETRRVLAEIMTGVRLRPTAALMAVASTPMRKVLTTNYDDAIERAACRRGLKPVPMLGTDVRAQDTPPEGELYVIHIHGMPSEPGSLVLPGKTTEALIDDERFTRFISTTLASRELLYLGFSLGEGELHLHEILKWIAAKVGDARPHYLLLPEDEIAERADEIKTISGYGNVKVAAYVKDASHTGVERAALALAPRSQDESAPGEQVTLVRALLAEFDPADGWEQIQRAASSFDLGTGFTTVIDPSELLDQDRAIVVAGPGMGKTTLLRNLPSLADGRPCGIARLADFRPAGDGVDPAESIWERLFEIGGDKPLRVEVLDGSPGVLLLDGLEEAGSKNTAEVVNAIDAACRQRPQHSWIVASRPSLAAVELAGVGFKCFGILASRKWAKTYLETRGVPEHRVRKAMLGGYGLGDLLTIPQFAARLADRLLDEDDHRVFTPLDLLVVEQQSVAAREAQTRRVGTELLARWLRGIAAGLELRGLASASVADIAAVVAGGPSTPLGNRNMLVELSLLVDVPDIAAFQHKTLQEGIVARAVLDSPDPVGLVELIATDRQSGSPVVRDDTEFTLDLIFEHANSAQRAALRSVDERRWARTVITRGTIDDGRDALGVLLHWYEQRGLPFLSFESGLRTSLAAAGAIAGKWPQLVEERRAQLIADLGATDPARGMRALTLLAQLPADADTASWLLPLLHDSRSQIASEAVALAGRLRFEPAADRVLELVASPAHNNVRRAALVASVHLLPPERLPDLAAVLGHNALQYLTDRLLDRNDFDLDTGIAFVSRAREMDETTAWIAERLIATAHRDAWTEARVRALALSLRKISGGGTPDPEKIAAAFNNHPNAALTAFGSLPSAPAARGVTRPVLLAFSKMDGALLAGDDMKFLKQAVEDAVVEEAEIDGRTNRAAELQLAGIIAKLDADGVNVPLEDVTTGAPRLRRLDEPHRAILAAIIDKQWPASLMGEQNEEVASRIVFLGADIRSPLTRDRWMQLLELYLSNSLIGQFEMSGDIPGWLNETMPADGIATLKSMMAAAADSWTLTKLVATAGVPRVNASLTATAFDRLRQLPPDERHWNTCASLLIGEETLDEGRTLLALTLPEGARNVVTVELAREGDPDAQVDGVARLEDEVCAGKQPQTPHWTRGLSEPRLLDALETLARAAIDNDAPKVLGFALGAMLESESDHALMVMTRLEADYGNTNADVSIRAEQIRRQRARRTVLARLPPTVAEAAEWFETHTAAPSGS